MKNNKPAGLALLLLCALWLLSMVSFDPGDPPATSRDHFANLCGRFGAYSAHYGHLIFGFGAWLWPMLVGAVGLSMLTRGVDSDKYSWRPWAGTIVSLLALVGILSWAGSDGAGLGGLAGDYIVARLGFIFGSIGAAVILCFALVIGAGFWMPEGLFSRLLHELRSAIADLRGAPADGPRQVPVGEGGDKPRKPIPVQVDAKADKPADKKQDEPDKSAEAPAKAEKAKAKVIRFPGFVKPEEDENEEPVKPVEQAPAKKADARQSTSAKSDAATDSAPAEYIAREINPEEKAFLDSLAKYRLPPVDLLKWPPDQSGSGPNVDDLQDMGTLLENTLKNFGIDAQVVQITPGPTVTLFELLPAPGVAVSKIESRLNDIQLALAATSIRIVAPIPGKSAVGIEIPNKSAVTVKLRELISFEKFNAPDFRLPVALGKDIHGKSVVVDLQRMPHLLVAGATGSGKSVCVSCILISLLYRRSPLELRLMLIDPKRVELTGYADIPHLLNPPITDARDATKALKWVVREMDRRLNELANFNAKHIESYNDQCDKAGLQRMPYIVVVVDELADLMLVASNDVEKAITRIAQMARAVGIHLVIATQRPSVDVITGLIKANMPARISFQLMSQIDSRTILDGKGAESLIGKGDMLFLSPGAPKPIRLQGAYVDEDESRRVIEFVRKQAEPLYVNLDMMPAGSDIEGLDESVSDEDIDPALYRDAKRFTIEIQKGSTSMIQKKFKVGFNRASKIMEMLEKDGVVGPNKGPTPRDVMVPRSSLGAPKEEKNGD